MTHSIDDLGNGIVKIVVSFKDEGIELPTESGDGETHIKGTVEDAEKYVKVFEKDLRRNYSHLFPVPEPEMPEMPEGMEEII